MKGKLTLTEAPAPRELKIVVSEPTYPEATTLTKDDVWGKWDDNHKKIHDGMVVARSEQPCPYFGDTVPYKSVTVVCQKDQYDEVVYWLEYVQGGNCVSNVKELDDERLAIRCDYQCW